MTVLSEGPLCLKIHLNKYELKKYFTSYNNINVKDSDTRKIIITLFNVAIDIYNFNAYGKRLIEVFPTVSGGCILKLTTEPLCLVPQNSSPIKEVKLKRLKSKSYTYIFCFKNFENLLPVVARLYKNKKTKNYPSWLYVSDNKFFFKITLPVFEIGLSLFINEFCEYSTKGRFAESKLAEYSNLLIAKNAVEILGKHFIKP